MHSTSGITVLKNFLVHKEKQESFEGFELHTHAHWLILHDSAWEVTISVHSYFSSCLDWLVKLITTSCVIRYACVVCSRLKQTFSVMKSQTVYMCG